MAMRDAINDFFSQFEYEPILSNSDNFRSFKKFAMIGMGGSHLAADILQSLDDSLDIIVHSDYGLPNLPEQELRERLIICSSYSGNTEETIDAFCKAKELGLARAVISVHGKLLELAEEENVPYVKLLDTGIQPRLALGYSFRALAKLVGAESLLKDSDKLVQLRASDFEKEGKSIAEQLIGRVPVIYSSLRNSAVGYIWKINLNETGKIPAFYNVFPELNHNEMTGFDVKEGTKHLSEKFIFIFLRDKDDSPKIVRRMEITRKLYLERGLSILDIVLRDGYRLKQIFAGVVIANWTAYYTAESYGVEAEQVPMVEEFKRLVRNKE